MKTADLRRAQVGDIYVGNKVFWQARKIVDIYDSPEGPLAEYLSYDVKTGELLLFPRATCLLRHLVIGWAARLATAEERERIWTPPSGRGRKGAG